MYSYQPAYPNRTCVLDVMQIHQCALSLTLIKQSKKNVGHFFMAVFQCVTPSITEKSARSPGRCMTLNTQAVLTHSCFHVRWRRSLSCIRCKNILTRHHVGIGTFYEANIYVGGKLHKEIRVNKNFRSQLIKHIFLKQRLPVL